MDRTYITGFADVLIIGSILVCYGSFLASHEFFERYKNELIASENVNIHSSIVKLKSYLYGFIGFNFIFLNVLTIVFWPVELLLLFLLAYRVINV